MSGYFFQQGNISVDATMAKFGMTSYPIANIGSVSVEGVERMAKQIALGALMLLIGIFTIFTITIGVGIFLVFFRCYNYSCRCSFPGEAHTPYLKRRPTSVCITKQGTCLGNQIGD